MSSSRKPLSLFLTCISPGIWAQFYSWYDKRNADRTADHHPDYPTSGHGIWVARTVESPVVVNGIPLLFPDGSSQPELIAGCCIFPCDGPFAIIDYVSTNPAVSPRVRRAAMEKVCWGIRNYGAMTAKKPVCHPMHKGVIKMMEKTGYSHVKTGVIAMYSIPWVPIGVVDEPVQNGVDTEPATIEAVTHVG